MPAGEKGGCLRKGTHHVPLNVQQLGLAPPHLILEESPLVITPAVEHLRTQRLKMH